MRGVVRRRLGKPRVGPLGGPMRKRGNAATDSVGKRHPIRSKRPPCCRVRRGALSAVRTGQGPPFASCKGRPDTRRLSMRKVRDSGPEVRSPIRSGSAARRSEIHSLRRRDRHHLTGAGRSRRRGRWRASCSRLRGRDRSRRLGLGHIHTELRRRGVTLALLWEKYCVIIPRAAAIAVLPLPMWTPAPR
jgi:hypothetical protein